ncbi:gluconokinase [Wenxinia marina]|uniref:Gluconokinase n=1 Tax=Wenxinia marina DSM 24838 TaxID=1123501 RepID=A0A0D0NSA3_9RHOB|nr:gluconokinase [Wenxinia marina]KIQ71105.1 carbohydrate kinase, thermoresistant glucokinase family [Wenxinia marina DSM 24838]GGL54798.1 gluconokinase [Wenxinia marina]
MQHSIVVMGVSGSGKSLIGRMLADRLGLDFIDGDDLHPEENVRKMAGGHPLEDADRWVWLDRVGAELGPPEPPKVIACSALKRIYRDRIRTAAKREVGFLLLHGDTAILRQRMQSRAGHFMPLSLLDSQIATLERPTAEERAVIVDVARTPEQIVNEAARRLRG